ncbi:MAG: hypothetical protein PHU03_03075 [Syntrophales bacterium]|nr:hypothetical protein [Syntrophales bacterium]
MKCPKCGATMVFIVYSGDADNFHGPGFMYCLFDGTTVSLQTDNGVVRADDPMLNEWRAYL